MSESSDSKPTLDERLRSGPLDETSDAAKPAPEPPSYRYCNTTEIARGGMGRVVEATDTLLGRRVAVKEALGTDPEMLRRFARETRVTARLEHPSIVPVYDAGKTPDGSPYYVMRKVSGQPLEELVATASTLEKRLALLPHVLAAAQAIGHAHGRGILHRDLKPSNILVGDLGETVVIDWGLAKVIDEPDDDAPLTAIEPADSLHTRIGTVIGTPGFMSPEQLRGEPVERPSDVYALGATLYHLLCRQPPHAADSGDEMMVRAAKGPPIPIAELVPGVPRELSTIADKALAFDATLRYPDAGAFAEEIRRFLTGQLVASHRYSARERLIRFVRKNRVPVGAVTVAVVALVVGGSVAVRSVLAERDRADESARVAMQRQHEAEVARSREQDRADQLFLVQARTLVDTNPTSAVAMLKQLAAQPEHWPEVWRQARAIAADAKIAGVAWGLPGPIYSLSLKIAPSGRRALVTGRDGTIRVYDLVARTSQLVATILPERNAVFADDDHLVSYRDNELSIFGMDGQRRDVLLPFAVHAAEATPDHVYMLDAQQRLWRMPIAEGAPEHILVDQAIDELAIAPDFRSFVFSSRSRLAVASLVDSTLAIRDLGPGRAVALSWSADSRDVAVSYMERAGRVNVASGAARWFPTRGPAMSPVIMGDNLMVADSYGGASWIENHTLVPRWSRDLVAGQGLHGSPHDRVIATFGNRILVFDGTRDLEIIAPVEAIQRAFASPASPYIIATTPGHVLVWNIDDVIAPKTTVMQRASSYAQLGATDYLVQSMDMQWFWIDQAAGTSTPFDDLPLLVDIAPSLHGDHALVIPGAADTRSRLTLVHKADHTVEVFDDHLAFGIFKDDDTVLLATTEGSIIAYDWRNHRRETLTSRKAEVHTIAWEADWVAAAFSDGTLWRRNVVTGVQSTLSLQLPKTGRFYAMRQFPDGKLCYPYVEKIMCWQSDGTVVEHAHLPSTIAGMAMGATIIVVTLTDNSGYVVDLAKPNSVVSSMSAGTRRVSMSMMSNLAVYETAQHTPEMLDLIAGQHWPLVRRNGRIPLRYASISRDGTQVSAIDEGGALAQWKVEIPQDAASTKVWLDRLTNATAELGPTTVTWH